MRRGIGLLALAASGLLDIPEGKQSYEAEYDDQQYADDAGQDVDHDGQGTQFDQTKGCKRDAEEGEERHLVVAFMLIEKETPTIHPDGHCCR